MLTRLFTGMARQPLYQRYLERLSEIIEMVPDHDIIGHFDYICRYAPYSDRKMRYKEIPQAFDHFFKS
jgi:histidinol-phosphatase (PHP family)